MKKTLVLSIILTIILFLPIVGKSTVIFDPLELPITMKNEFIQGNTSKNITITNNNTYSVNATWYLEHPNPDSYLRPNKTFIPDLSWIDVEPKWIVIPPSGIAKFYILLDIPAKDETLNQHWETWITFQLDDNNAGGEIFEREYAIRVYIDTPLDAVINNSYISSNSNDYTIYYLIIAVIAITSLVLIILFYRKKE
jgi:hypothetical protein